MPLSRTQKQAILGDLAEQFRGAKSVFFSTYRGLNVNDISKMRSELRDDGCRMVVSKKTLIRLAAKQGLDLDLETDTLPGPIAAVFSNTDEVVAAKVVSKWSKDKPDFVQLVGGVFEGKVLSAAEANAIASIPSREELLSKLVGSLQSPVSRFVRSLKSPLSGLTNVLRELSTRGN